MIGQDVWIVSNWEAIQWMQQPTPQSQMDTFLPWKTCDDPIQPEDQACNIPRSAVIISVVFSLMLYINIHSQHNMERVPLAPSPFASA